MLYKISPKLFMSEREINNLGLILFIIVSETNNINKISCVFYVYFSCLFFDSIAYIVCIVLNEGKRGL